MGRPQTEQHGRPDSSGRSEKHSSPPPISVQCGVNEKPASIKKRRGRWATQRPFQDMLRLDSIALKKALDKCRSMLRFKETSESEQQRILKQQEEETVCTRVRHGCHTSVYYTSDGVELGACGEADPKDPKGVARHEDADDDEHVPLDNQIKKEETHMIIDTKAEYDDNGGHFVVGHTGGGYDLGPGDVVTRSTNPQHSTMRTMHAVYVSRPARKESIVGTLCTGGSYELDENDVLVKINGMKLDCSRSKSSAAYDIKKEDNSRENNIKRGATETQAAKSKLNADTKTNTKKFDDDNTDDGGDESDSDDESDDGTHSHITPSTGHKRKASDSTTSDEGVRSSKRLAGTLEAGHVSSITTLNEFFSFSCVRAAGCACACVLTIVVQYNENEMERRLWRREG